MSEYLADVQKYSANASEANVAAIVKYCGIALRNKDSSLVSASDPAELQRVRDGFAFKKLGLDATSSRGTPPAAKRVKPIDQGTLF